MSDARSKEPPVISHDNGKPPKPENEETHTSIIDPITFLKVVSSSVQAIGSIGGAYIKGQADKNVALINQQTELSKIESQSKLQESSLQCQERLENLKEKLKTRLVEYEQERKDERLEYQQRCEDKRLKKQLEYQVWNAYFQRETQQLLALINLESIRIKADDDEIRQAYPLETPQRILLDDYIDYYQNCKRIPPLVIFSPAFLDSGRRKNNLPSSLMCLGKKISSTLIELYPLNDECGRQVRYQDMDWRDQQRSGRSALSTLNRVLKSIPTIVVDEQFEGDEISYYFGWWNHMGNLRHQKMFSVKWKDFLYLSARQHALEWQLIRDIKLNNSGSDWKSLSMEQLESQIEEEGGVDQKNLKKLQQEESDKKIGGRFEYDYKYHIDDERYANRLVDFVSVYVALTVGFFIDNYYMFEYAEMPSLPLLIPNLFEKLKDQTLERKMASDILQKYLDSFDLLRDKPLAEDVPTSALLLAKSLTKLKDKSLSTRALDYAITYFMDIKNIRDSGKDTFLKGDFDSLFNCAEDEDFAEALYSYFVSIGEIDKASKLRKLLRGWQEKMLNREITRNRKGLIAYGLF